MRLRILIVTCALLLGFAAAQDHSMDNMSDMPGMNHDTSAMHSESGADHAMNAMQSHHMDMGPHMKMSTLRDPEAGDQERAAEIAEQARKTAEKYKDYRAALKDGYKIFLPNVPQKMYHFTNNWYAMEAAFHFNPEKPTSLLYEKQGDDYKLIGVMYTAPKRATEDELNKRVPLSVAQWHAHVNLCMPPKDRHDELWQPHPRFGLAGSIATEQECNAAGGKWIPQVFGWMVHVYPFEQNVADIWSVDRQHGGMAAHPHSD
jgi:hypothetical protein